MMQHILDKAVAGERLSPRRDWNCFRDAISLPWAERRRPSRGVSILSRTARTTLIGTSTTQTSVPRCATSARSIDRRRVAEGYLLPRDVVLAKIDETVGLGGNQILLQGGLHPTLPLTWYEELLRDIKRSFPQVNVHGFSPPEIHHFTKVSRLSLQEVLERLRAAGLGSIPGGGAEILVDRVRREITRGKVLSDDWLNVMRVWHQMGGRSSATMMFGHVETLEERVEHLDRLRQLQDETGGFTAFIGWTFQPDNTAMSHIPHATPVDYLRTQAVARLYLDNFANIQSSWVTQGLKIGQLAMLFGANDMGSLMIEENVVAEAGTVHFLTLEEIRQAIVELGYVPRQRNVFYDLVSSEQELRAVEANRRVTAA